MQKLLTLPNVGDVLAQNLVAVGITTPEELRRLGTKEAFTRIRLSVDSGACLAMLYGIEGAVRGIPKKELPPADKEKLCRFYKSL